MVQQLYAQDTCLYVTRRSYKLQIGNLINLIINIGPRGHYIVRVEVSASCRSLMQRSPTECGVCLSVIVEHHRGGLDPLGLYSHNKIYNI
jgi:hypothetical protein